ncbi:MAG TPA: alpha-2-macroglobulin [Azospirillaceae bacterium]|nr:alpha-2-macroglobulin [Azospirillaceae bacterium]
MKRSLGLVVAVALGLAGTAQAYDTSPAPPPPVITPPTPAESDAPPVPEGPQVFDVTGLEVVAERDAPQVCLNFNGRLERARGTALAGLLAVDPAVPVTAVARDKALCVEGLAHGGKYHLTLQPGLASADGRRLEKAIERDIEVPNRAPALAFRSGGHILPRVGADGLPLRAINIDKAQLQVQRINDRDLVERIYFGRVTQSMTEWDVGELVGKAGQEVWKGELAMVGPRNAPTVAAFPIESVLGDLEPGVYVAVAASDAVQGKGWEGKATQWFVVSDLGLTSYEGDDGLMVFARSLVTAEPVAGVEVRLWARGHTELGKAVTGPDGMARFDAAALRGDGDAAPQALFAYGASGDFGFLDLSTPAVDLADRGVVGGREVPGTLDAFLYTERGIYRPGEAVNLTALVRDQQVKAVTGAPLTFKLVRPDGFEAARQTVDDAGGGSHAARFALAPQALTGKWTVTAHTDAEGPVVGSVAFTVEDFVPPRIELAVESDRRVIGEDGKAQLKIGARTLYGAAASNLAGELSVTLRGARNPYPQHAGYRFGLAQDEFQPVRTELPGFTTDGKGNAKAEVALAPIPDTSDPLEAEIRANLFDIGGRPVTREVVVPVHHQPLAIGIKPHFDGDAVPENATVAFDVIAVAPDGTPQDKGDLSYELFEEELAYAWYAADGRWDYKTEFKEHRLTGGTLSVTAAKPAEVEEPVKTGRYRLDVFDPATGVASSVRFGAGWWVAPTATARPDKVDVSVMLPSYKPGDVARVYVKPPYAAQVVVTVADRQVRKVIAQAMGPEGAFLDVPVEEGWGAGVTVLATAFAPAAPDKKTLPRRALGSAWLAMGSAPRTLGVKLAAPAEVAPRGTLTVPVTVTGAAEGEAAFVTVTAADTSVLQLTGQSSADPNTYFLGKRRPALELRDVYGRLVEPAGAAVKAKAGNEAPLRLSGALPRRSSQVVSLYSGVLTVGADGKVAVPFDLPDFQGRLRLMAVAWTAGKVGHADAEVTVRDAIVAEVALPRFLAPGDRARATISLDNLAAATGDYTVRLTAEGALGVEKAEATFKGLGKGKRAAHIVELTGGTVGAGTLRLEVSGPGGFALSRAWTIPVRPAVPPVTRRQAAMLEPGKTAELVPDTAGLRPETVAATLVLAPLPVLDAPSLLLALDRYPYAGAEPLASRILAFLAAGGQAAAVGLGEDEVKARIRDALDRLTAFQRADGSFALWSARGESEMWLTAYVVDVLDRARAGGHPVDHAAWRQGLDWLKKTVDRTWLEEAELPARAYAYLVLARAKMVEPSAVRWFSETYGKKLQTDLARVQVAAATALMGDAEAAKRAFAQVGAPRLQFAGLRDFGSDLRDQAAALATLADSGLVEREPILALARKLAPRVVEARSVSTQEAAWLVTAARALAEGGASFKLDVDGAAVEGGKPVWRRFDPSAPPMVKNTGSAALNQMVTVTGVPVEVPVPEAHGFEMTRKVFDIQGNPVDLARVRPNDVLVVMLEGESLDGLEHRALVVDRLPAGLEIENVRVADSAPLGGLSWLGDLSPARAVDFRDDRFVAAIDLHQFRKSFRLVYLARAVVPGDFDIPGAYVEDMYRPTLFARGAGGRLTVQAE